MNDVSNPGGTATSKSSGAEAPGEGAIAALEMPPPSAGAVSAFQTADRPRWEDYSRCVHCGLCLNVCPTFRLLGEEMDSPRGRIYQIAQADAGRIGLDELRMHLERCLDCRACETACPSGVQYGRILEAARAELAARPAGSALRRRLRHYLFARVLPSRGRIRFYAALLAAAQRSGLEAFGRRSGLLRALGLEPAARLAPAVSRPVFHSEIGRTFPARGDRRARVVLLAGCIQNVFCAPLNRAALGVLQANGCEVSLPAGQTCCGALHVHAGERETARRLARQNLAAFNPGDYDAIVTAAAGCGSALKEYGDLLAGDERARAFAAKVRDITEFLAALGMRAEGLRPLPVSVTFQDACHLAHGQRIRSAPRELLRAVPGLKLVEMRRADQCCGSAGIYNLEQPEIAVRLLEEKMELVAETGAAWLVTANPGCQLQLQAGVRAAGRSQPVLHVVELLARAYGLNE